MCANGDDEGGVISNGYVGGRACLYAQLISHGKGGPSPRVRQGFTWALNMRQAFRPTEATRGCCEPGRFMSRPPSLAYTAHVHGAAALEAPWRWHRYPLVVLPIGPFGHCQDIIVLVVEKNALAMDERNARALVSAAGYIVSGFWVGGNWGVLAQIWKNNGRGDTRGMVAVLLGLVGGIWIFCEANRGACHPAQHQPRVGPWSRAGQVKQPRLAQNELVLLGIQVGLH